MNFISIIGASETSDKQNFWKNLNFDQITEKPIKP